MWPFSEAYPERRGEEVDGQTFDYIVVGGGTAGCALASRLSEPGSWGPGGGAAGPPPSVLVLEKGRVGDVWMSRVPLLGQNFLSPSLQAVADRWSEPVANAHGKRMMLSGASAVGGSSRINASIATRGVPGGYQQWAQEFGLDEWGWDAVEPYLRRLENAVDHPHDESRGHDGPLVVRQLGHGFDWYPYLEKACRAAGLPVEDDCNTPGAPAQGYFHLDLAIAKSGHRESAYQTYLGRRIALERREHLFVCTGSAVSRLEVDGEADGGGGLKQVRGVHFRADGREFFVRARRGVIICSGALTSPHLLMLSGIGPKDQLEKHGIPLAHELPAVGQNLYDHVAFPLQMKVPLRQSVDQLQVWWLALWNMLLWLVWGTGLLACSTTPYSIFLRSTALDTDDMTVRATDASTGADAMDARDPRNVPDVECMINAVQSCVRRLPGDPPVLSLYNTLTQPYSVGSVELAFADPAAHPRVHFPFLSDGRDRTAMRRAVRFGMRLAGRVAEAGYPPGCPLVSAPGVNPHLLPPKGSDTWAEFIRPPSPIPGAPALRAVQRPYPELRDASGSWASVADDEVDEFARRVGSMALHFSCTCRISLTARDGVVDQRLRVHGFANLRVADASVFPKIPSGHTMVPTLMVAERCADFVKAEWRERKGQ